MPAYIHRVEKGTRSCVRVIAFHVRQTAVSAEFRSLKEGVGFLQLREDRVGSCR